MAAKSVTPSVAPTVQLANTDHWLDVMWAENPAKFELRLRLKRVDKSVKAAATIVRIMHRDLLARVDLEDSSERNPIVYPTLCDGDTEHLFVALGLLLGNIDEDMEDLRENKCGIANPEGKVNV